MFRQKHRLILIFGLIIGLLPVGAIAEGNSLPSPGEKSQSNIKVAYFSKPPPAIVSLAQSFDPDSYAVISQIFDSLVHLDLDGQIQPALATQWHRLSPTRWHFQLRKGVKFHNGEPFNANAVKFTFDYILNPKNKAGNLWIFNSLLKVEKVKNKPLEIIFETKFPDGMLLNRMSMFGAICPPRYIQTHGIDYFAEHPIGTGPYRIKAWDKKSNIVLNKNPDYWQENIPYLDEVEFVTIRPNQQIDAFVDGEIDFIPNLSGNQTSRLMRLALGKARIIKRPVLMSYWVMLKNEGALKDLRVRKALNYAVNKQDLIRFADFGNALPMASLGKQGEFGANQDLTPYAYAPAEAKQLLLDAEVNTPLVLKGLVAEVALPVAKIIQKQLADIGVQLAFDVVSRSEWSRQVVGYKIATGKRPDYDLTINLVDNPIYNLAFHAGLFLNSKSPWSLLHSPEFDAKFEQALMVADQKQHEKQLKALDTYIHNQALMLFTTQKVITAAVKTDYDIEKFGASGHLDYFILSHARLVKD